MTEAAGWVVVALIAILVGAAVPVLLQLRKTLKAAEATLTTTGSKLNDALDQLSITLERVNSAADELDRGVKKMSSLIAALGSVGDALSKVRSTVGTVASLGSIVGGALLGAFGFGSRDKRREDTGEPLPGDSEQVR
jgi:uncharacterized protein YoxC